MSAPKRKQSEQRAERRPEPAVDAVTLDPEFDNLDGADAEFAAWRWPERDHD